MDSDFEPLYHITRGWMEQSLAMSGAKAIESEFVARSWKGDAHTSIKFSWGS